MNNTIKKAFLLIIFLIMITLLAQNSSAVVITSHWENTQAQGDFLTINQGESASFKYIVGGPELEYQINFYRQTVSPQSLVKNIVPFTKLPSGVNAEEATITLSEQDYKTSGKYLIVIDAKDKYNSMTYTLELTVLPAYNDVDFSSIAITANPKTGTASLTVTFTCNAVGGNSPISYFWDFGDGKISSNPNTQHTYAEPGLYMATCTAKDYDDDQISKSIQILVIKVETNEAPTALFTANPQTGYAPLTVDFDASQSFDPDGSIEKYYWYANDGMVPFAQGITAEKTFAQPGDYIITLKVVDNEGASSIAKKTITVKEHIQENHPPVADFSYTPKNPKIFQQIKFDGLLSSDPDGDELTYSWDFDNDGLFDSFEKNTIYAYAEPGKYPVKLEVSDGKLKDSKTKTITVTAKLDVDDISCFDKIVEGHEQTCSVLVKAEGVPLKNADVKIFFGDDSEYGECLTNRLGNCRVERVMESTGNFSVYATAEKLGYISDLDKEPKFFFTVYKERYEIEDLKVFSDPSFETESYEFFRGENLYVEFKVVEKNTNSVITQDIVTKAALVSQGHEAAELDKIGLHEQKFRYRLTPIPLSYGFIGQSQIFTFAFNFTDGSGGQRQADLLIKNNPPEITPPIADVEVTEGETIAIDLSKHEYDKEDEYSQTDDIYWEIEQTSDYFDAVLEGKQLVITGLQKGHGIIIFKLTDWDGDSDLDTIKVDVLEGQHENHAPVLAPIGNKIVFAGETLLFDVSASDSDNDTLGITASNLPDGASFLAGHFEWTPTSLQIGSYDVTFTASDGELSDSETIIITVKQHTSQLSADVGGPYTAYPKQDLNIDASGSHGDILEYFFEFGDGHTETTTQPYVVYSYSGNQKIYSLRLTVTDIYGNTAQDSTIVTMLKEQEEKITESTYVGEIDIYGIYSNRQYASVGNEDIVVSLVVKNDGETDEKDMTVTAMIPELGIKRKTSSFSLDEGDSTRKQLMIPVYDAPKGEYYMKLVIGNDGKTRVKYRYFTVE